MPWPFRKPPAPPPPDPYKVDYVCQRLTAIDKKLEKLMNNEARLESLVNALNGNITTLTSNIAAESAQQNQAIADLRAELGGADNPRITSLLDALEVSVSNVQGAAAAVKGIVPDAAPAAPPADIPPSDPPAEVPPAA